MSGSRRRRAVLGAWSVALFALALVCAAFPAASYADTPEPLPANLWLGNPTGPLVTDGQARAILAAMWPLREKALASDDIAGTDRLEDGVAREFDDSVSLDDRARPQHPGLRRVRGYGQVAVFVPRQASYPAAFLAEIDTSVHATVPEEGAVAGAPYIELLVMTRQDASSPWKVSLDTGSQGSGTDTPAADAEGFDAEPPPTWVQPSEVHGLLAAYWQHWKDTGAAPADAAMWHPGYWTVDRAKQIGEQRNGTASPRCGCIGDLQYWADPADPRWTFALRYPPTGGAVWQMTCGTLRMHERLVPQLPNGVLVQDEQRDHWGGWLTPGLYSSLTNDYVRQSCIVAGTSKADQLRVVGGNGGLVNVQGTRMHGLGPVIPRSGLRFHLTPLVGLVAAGSAGLTLVAVIVGVVLWAHARGAGRVNEPYPYMPPIWPHAGPVAAPPPEAAPPRSIDDPGGSGPPSSSPFPPPH